MFFNKLKGEQELARRKESNSIHQSPKVGENPQNSRNQEKIRVSGLRKARGKRGGAGDAPLTHHRR